MSSVILDGSGPFDLPAAQQVAAEAIDDQFVTLTFRVLADPNRLEAVRIAVTNNQALQLADQIVNAIERQEAEGPSKGGVN